MSAMVDATASEDSGGDEQEETHWRDVARTFLAYFDFMLRNLDKRRDRIGKLSIVNFNLLPACTYDKINNIEHACQSNQDILDDIVTFYEHSDYLHFVSEKSPLRRGSISLSDAQSKPIDYNQQHRNKAVLHSLYREWTAEGDDERRQAFDIITNELRRLLPVTKDNAYQQKVLLPGCGLGRLPIEIAAMGYCAQGNEFSAFMVMANQFILNGITVQSQKSYLLFPWLDKESNVLRIQDIFQSCKVPDITAESILSGGLYSDRNPTKDSFPRFSMVAGDFVELYSSDGHASAWNAVVTCFFIDTAPVIMDYFRVIHGLLPTGGIWINLGPLLYHWAEDSEGSCDERFGQSIELSFEEIEQILLDIGFEFITKEFGIKCNYCNFHKGLMYTTYNAIFFSVRKTNTFKKQIM